MCETVKQHTHMESETCGPGVSVTNGTWRKREHNLTWYLFCIVIQFSIVKFSPAGKNLQGKNQGESEAEGVIFSYKQLIINL